METAYTYLFIRKDLTPAQRIVQAAHAAHNAGERFGDHSHLICFGIDNEAELQKTAAYLESRGIEFEVFHEPDYNTGYTAICTRPMRGEERKIMRRFTLLKG